MEDAVEEFAGANAFEFRFGAQEQAMFQHRDGHGAEFVGADEIAAGESRPGTRGAQQGLRGARSGPTAILFFDSLAAGDSVVLHYRLRAKYPIRARTFQSRVYEYYDPAVGSVARPVALEVGKR